jgi:hypothetical protein
MTVDLRKFPLPCFVKLRNGKKVWLWGIRPFDSTFSGEDSSMYLYTFSANGRPAYVSIEYHEKGESDTDIISEWKEPRSVEYVVYEHDGVLRVVAARTAKVMSQSISIVGRGVWKEGEQE